MDTPTLIIAALVVATATALSMAIVFWTRRTYPGFGYWLAGALCRAVAVVFFLLPREVFPPWLTIVLANYLLFAEFILYIRGTLIFRGQPVHNPWDIAASLAFIALLGWFTVGAPNLNARIAVSSVFEAVWALWLIRVLLNHRPPYFGSLDRWQAAVWAVLAGVNLSRAAYAATLAPPLDDYLSGPAYQSPWILIMMLISLLVALNQIIMNAQRLEYDLRLTQEQLERDIAERRQAEEAVRLSLAEIRRHAEQLSILNGMNERLLSCETHGEAWEAIAAGAGQLFAPHGGGLAMVREGTPGLVAAASWGDPSAFQAWLSRVDCQHLGAGGSPGLKSSAGDLICPLAQGLTCKACLCVPLVVQGQALGLLRVIPTGDLSVQARQELQTLTLTVSESVKLSLSNLALRHDLREQAIRDALTGLFNRRYLDATLHRELSQCERTGEPLVVAMLDLDHFKRFNDNFGHEAGDLVLQEVGALLLRSLRGGDIACRYGGEELTLILHGATLAQSRGRLETLRQSIKALRLPYRGTDLPALSVSIGIAQARPGESADALLGRADTALYRAKQQGRNRIVVWDVESA